MTYEFKEIISQVLENQQHGKKSVLASVVALDGSSYRKPGVRMLITEGGKITGAVSGGCVEKDVLFEAQSVLKTGIAKMMTYDGRYRLGCEGTLYILLEPMSISLEFEQLFFQQIAQRKSFKIESFFKKEVGELEVLESVIDFGEKQFSMTSRALSSHLGLEKFSQQLSPVSKLIIIGAEHDSVKLGILASQLGWEVSIVSSPKDPKTTENFPGSKEVLALEPEQAKEIEIDNQTAVVLMTHNYARDLHFLLSIKDKHPFYIGILGSTKRREKMYNELIEMQTDIEFNFFDKLYGPAGIDIGAITPEEIAVAILAEILAVKRGKSIPSLREKMGAIH